MARYGIKIGDFFDDVRGLGIKAVCKYKAKGA